MAVQTILADLRRVDEPGAAEEYSEVISRVAAGEPLIVRREGKDVAAVLPVALLETILEGLARQGVEEQAAKIDWRRAGSTLRPPQNWFDDTDNPFEPEEESTP